MTSEGLWFLWEAVNIPTFDFTCQERRIFVRCAIFHSVIKTNFITFIYWCVLKSRHMCGAQGTTCWKLVLPFYHVGSRDQTLVTKLESEFLFPVSCLASPSFCNFKSHKSRLRDIKISTTMKTTAKGRIQKTKTIPLWHFVEVNLVSAMGKCSGPCKDSEAVFSYCRTQTYPPLLSMLETKLALK